VIEAAAPPVETPIGLEDVRRQWWTTDIDATAISRMFVELQGELKGSAGVTSAVPSTPRLRYYIFATGIARHLPLTVPSHWTALAIAAGAVSLVSVPISTPTPYIQHAEAAATAPVPDTLVVATISRSASFRKFKDVARWLGLSDEAAAELVGVGRTTPYSWERRAHEPRPSKAGRLFEYHALLSSLVRRLGASGLDEWLVAGSPRPRQLLLGGNLGAAYDAAHEFLFTPGRPEVGLGALQPETQVAPPRSAGMAVTDEVKGSVRHSRKMRV
jgi:hypothetical protein